MGEAKEADVVRRASCADTDGIDVIEFEERAACAPMAIRAHEVASETIAIHYGAASFVRDSRSLSHASLGRPCRSSESLPLEALDQTEDG